MKSIPERVAEHIAALPMRDREYVAEAVFRGAALVAECVANNGVGGIAEALSEDTEGCALLLAGLTTEADLGAIARAAAKRKN